MSSSRSKASRHARSRGRARSKNSSRVLRPYSFAFGMRLIAVYSRRSTSPAMSGWARMRSRWAGRAPMETGKQQNVQ